MVPHNLLNRWGAEEIAKMHNANFVAQHRLGELELFSDEALAETLDAHPHQDLGVYTMGRDPVRRDQWQVGDAGGLSGETLLEAVRRGRLWLNLRRMMDHHDDFRIVVDALYDELESLCDGEPIFNRSGTLTIASPSAQVYYHVDCLPNMLWHIRGTRRVWVYPLEADVLSPRALEAVLSGAAPEEVEYYPELDRYARVVDLEPGQMITWPQHTPHRVVNTGGLNVSLSTEHMTRHAARKNNVYLANRYLRHVFPCCFRSTELSGVRPALKELAIRVARRLPLIAPRTVAGHRHPITFRVDPSAANGVRPLNGPPRVGTIVAPMPDVPSVDVPVGT